MAFFATLGARLIADNHMIFHLTLGDLVRWLSNIMEPENGRNQIYGSLSVYH